MKAHEYWMNIYHYRTSTCSINNLKDNCFTFIRDKSFVDLDKLEAQQEKDVVIIVPEDIKGLPGGFIYEPVKRNQLEYEFISLHNSIRANEIPAENKITPGGFIHDNACIGVEGIHVGIDATPGAPREPIQMRHYGNVEIGKKVNILAFATIQRAIFDSTIIEDFVQIDSRVNIGHNSRIGKGTCLALGAVVAGSVNIGENCMIGLGAIIRNNLNICDNVIIGMGSLVVNDITEPGIYMGSPAKYFKPYRCDWIF